MSILDISINNKNIDYISAEKIQLITDLFLRIAYKDNDNPNTSINHPKSLNINHINSYFNNPKYIYLYPDQYELFCHKIDFFNNKFVLVSGNSDYAVINNNICNFIANHPKVIRWFAQNLLYEHPKLEFIPIGFADSQYKYGNPKIITNIIKNLNDIKKINDIYFYFTINTNFTKRNDCFEKLKNYIPYLDEKQPDEYFDYLATFKFAICPEGNGVDTYRLWECFYFKVIPIVLDNILIRFVKKKYNLPMIILNDWTDLIGMELKYQDYDNSILDFNILKKEILNSYYINN
jgi:hypothetical protein